MSTLPTLNSASSLAAADLLLTRKDGEIVDKQITAALAKEYFTSQQEGATAEGNPVFTNTSGLWYGSVATPITGNITLDGTDAVIGGLSCIYHNDVAEPSISGLTVEKQTGTYVLNALNIIYVLKTPTGVAISIQGEQGAPANTIAPVITGFAYPNETLTASTGTWDGGGITYTYQWQVASQDISGATSSTYSPTVRQIGLSLTCIVTATNSSGTASETTAATVVWHPKDESGVNIVYLANTQALTSSGPDVEATQDQTVALWRDQTANAWNASHGTIANRPTRRVAEVSGNDILRFDGISQRLNIEALAARQLFSSKPRGYLLAAVKDNDNTGGEAYHTVLIWSNNVNGGRIGMYTRYNTTDGITGGTRRLDSDAFAAASNPHVAGFNVLTTEALWADGLVRLRIDGTQQASAALASSGNSDSTTSLTSRIGTAQADTLHAPVDIAGIIAVAPTETITAKSLARLERYLGLLVGKDIPLAEA